MYRREIESDSGLGKVKADVIGVLLTYCPPVYSPRFLNFVARQARRDGYMEAMRQVGVGEVRQQSIRPHEHVYTSVDGTQSFTFTQLLESLFPNQVGDEVSGAGLELDLSDLMVRIGVVLGHAEKRALEKDELEFLRQIKAVAEIMQFPYEKLCQGGQKQAEKLRDLVVAYEQTASQSQGDQDV